MQTKFPNVSKAEWLAKVEKDLKGKPLESLNFLVDKTKLSPFWHKEDLDGQHQSIKKEPGWKIGAIVYVNNSDEYILKEANKVALYSLNQGANALVFDSSYLLGKFEKNILLDGVLTDLVDIYWLYNTNSTRKESGQYDYTIAPSLNLSQAYQRLIELAKGQPTFWIEPSDDYFKTIATFRAVRLCWSRICNVCGVKDGCTIISFSPEFSGDDKNLNKIRGTSQIMSAIIGGADVVFSTPSELSENYAFGQRIALNIQHLLEYESHLDQVADPAAGSYYIEALTNTIAEKIWTEFQQTSKHG